VRGDDVEGVGGKSLSWEHYDVSLAGIIFQSGRYPVPLSIADALARRSALLQFDGVDTPDGIDVPK
jgi:hypothetical protein